MTTRVNALAEELIERVLARFQAAGSSPFDEELLNRIAALTQDLREAMTPQAGDTLFLSVAGPAHGRRAFHCLVLAAEHWKMNGCPVEYMAPSSQMLLGACTGAADILSRVEALATR